jgi:hypothetical protein
MLKHKDVSKFEGLGWIECQLSPFKELFESQFSLEVNSIDMVYFYLERLI